MTGEHAADAVHERSPRIGHLPRARFLAELLHGFDQQIDAEHAGMAVAQATARSVHRTLAVRPDAPLDERTTLAFRAETQIFESEDDIWAKKAEKAEKAEK